MYFVFVLILQRFFVLGLMVDAQCPEPAPVLNAYRTATFKQTKVAMDTFVNYTCYDGYYVSEGDSSRYCNASGNLTGIAPICSGKLLVVSISSSNH